MWIDIGAKSKEEALERVTIGDAAVYTHGLESLYGPLVVSRAFDDKSGAYAVNEALLRLKKERNRHPKWLQCRPLKKKSERGVPFPLPIL